jgi:putative endopeptidase
MAPHVFGGGAEMLSLIFTLLVSSTVSVKAEPAVDVSAMDSKVEPCQDFYQYACGTWLKKTKIPDDKPRWGRSFDGINERNQILLKDILQSYADGKFVPENPYAKQMGDLYASCMDEKTLEKNAQKDLRAYVGEIMALKDKKDFPALLAKSHLEGMNAFFSFGSSQDLKNSNLMIGEADQGGMGLPTKEYYSKETDDMKKVRAAYVEYLKSGLEIAGIADKTEEKAKAILDLETKIAAKALLPAERRDPKRLYHRVERKGVQKLTPDFDWTTYLTAMGEPKLTQINVTTPEFFTSVNAILSKLSLDEIKMYMTAHAFLSTAGAMDKNTLQAKLKFDGVLSGVKELPPRWKKCSDVVQAFMPFALGRSFVAKAFSPESKAEATSMMHEIEQALHDRIETLSWMDKKTKAAAFVKLAVGKNYMGYPEKWRSYDGIKMDRDSFVNNFHSGNTFDSRYELDKIGKPVDRSEWEMPPSLVNASKSQTLNTMYFPAGILQPPNFDNKRPIEANYGGIGAVMGHELTHGYDDEGRQFDKTGSMKDWWSKKTAAEFDKRAQCLEKQFDGYVVEGDLHVNGKLTLGENIADQGGLMLAYAAWQKEAAKRAKEMRKVSSEDKGFSPEQQFFISYAQLWCSKETDAFKKLMTNSNPHAIPEFRVKGTLSNNPGFAQAFNCKPGTPMAPEHQCVVW